MNFSTETPKNVKIFKKHILFLFPQILSKFEEEEEEGWEEYGISLWNTIGEHWKISNHVLDFFLGHCIHIKFWQDDCCKEQPPKDLFPALFSIASFRNASHTS